MTQTQYDILRHFIDELITQRQDRLGITRSAAELFERWLPIAQSAAGDLPVEASATVYDLCHEIVVWLFLFPGIALEEIEIPTSWLRSDMGQLWKTAYEWSLAEYVTPNMAAAQTGIPQNTISKWLSRGKVCYRLNILAPKRQGRRLLHSHDLSHLQKLHFPEPAPV
jgi:hypothetical protein